MRTPTDHWLEITIETRGAQGRGMAQGALQGNIVGEMRLNLLSLFLSLSLSLLPLSSPHNLSFSIFFPLPSDGMTKHLETLVIWSWRVL